MELKIISMILEEKVKRHAYLVIIGNTSILIDPGAKHHAPNLLSALSAQINISDLQYIILQSNDYLNLTSLEELNKEGFKGNVIVNESGLPYLTNMIKNNIQTIESLEYTLSLPNQQTLEFIPIPFLPFPECYITIIKEEGILFSAHLFSQSNLESTDTQALIRSINQFHEMVLPSIEFVRQGMNKLKKYQLKKIYPRLGRPLDQELIPDVFIKVLAYDFYNTNQVIEHKNKKSVSYNYENICNHMLKRLEANYSRTDILDIFQDTAIQLAQYPHLEIEQTTLIGYKLWNGFFDIIYQKKGVSWLTILEPIVKKYHQTYRIKLPAIYTTKTIEQQSEILDLNTEKQHLQDKVQELSTKITATTDKLLRCPITNLYNQRFMIGHLSENLNQPLEPKHFRGLLLVQIDNLLEINQKYGTQKGDETIRNLVHLMNNLKQEDTMLFKQNGPGFYVYKHQVKEKDFLQFALKVSNEVKKSDLFIEPITTSMSIVTTSELNQQYHPDEQINQLIELSQMRLERAKSKGKDQILDHQSDDLTYIEGNILIVDEDETYQNLMVKIFDRIHYQVIIASGIDDAYEKLENHNIDIIISEINLSKLDGFQLKYKINQSQTFRNIPFIMVSHHKNLEVITRCNLLDVDLILQKPIIPEELIGHIQRFREMRRTLS